MVDNIAVSSTGTNAPGSALKKSNCNNGDDGQRRIVLQKPKKRRALEAVMKGKTGNIDIEEFSSDYLYNPKI